MASLVIGSVLAFAATVEGIKAIGMAAGGVVAAAALAHSKGGTETRRCSKCGDTYRCDRSSSGTRCGDCRW